MTRAGQQKNEDEVSSGDNDDDLAELRESQRELFGPISDQESITRLDLSSAATAQTEAIWYEEAHRAAAFGRGTTILSTIGFIVALWREIPLRERVAILVATTILAFAGAGVWWRSRSVEHYSRRTFRLFGVASAVSSLVLVHALGVFSPIVVILVLGLAFFVAGRDKRFIIPVALSVIGAYALSAILVTIGVLPDRGVWRDPGIQQHISMTVIVTAVMITQFVLARANHRALLNAIAKSQNAMRIARTREAQLDEARELVDAALKAGDGRLTGALVGSWRIGDVVGRGAMGEVYAAHHVEKRDRVAAVKVLRTQDDAGIARRFLREAEIARKVRGPNLVEVFETGETSAGAIYITMELLTGQDLAALLREQRTLPLSEVVTLVEETANGLTVLHGAGVVHRDLKPQNLFRAVGSPPVWKILDYGVSKIVGHATVTENNLVGTPGYMSPEQAEGKDDIDLRSDVFSLGAVAYRAITGRRAFSGPDLPQILYQVVHGTPIRPRELVPSLPKEVETVLAIALAKRPADRFATAAELAASLRAACAGKASASRVPVARSTEKITTRAWSAEPTTLTLPRIDKKR